MGGIGAIHQAFKRPARPVRLSHAHPCAAGIHAPRCISDRRSWRSKGSGRSCWLPPATAVGRGPWHPAFHRRPGKHGGPCAPWRRGATNGWPALRRCVAAGKNGAHEACAVPATPRPDNRSPRESGALSQSVHSRSPQPRPHRPTPAALAQARSCQMQAPVRMGPGGSFDPLPFGSEQRQCTACSLCPVTPRCFEKEKTTRG